MKRKRRTSPNPRVVRAQRIELVDEQGHIKITLDAQTQGSVIRLWGQDGKLKASFGLLTTDQPAILFLDGLFPRVDLRLEEDGQPSFSLIPDRTMAIAKTMLEAIQEEQEEGSPHADEG